MERTKEKILQVAAKTFTKFGFHKTSVDEIAKAARKAKGSVYYYFTSKENLFTEVVKQELQFIKNELNSAVTNEKSAVDKIKNYFSSRIQLMHNSTNYLSTVKIDFFDHFDFLFDVKEEFRKFEKNTLKSLLILGIEKKEFTVLNNIDHISESLALLIKTIELQFEQHSINKNIQLSTETLVSLILKGASVK